MNSAKIIKLLCVFLILALCVQLTGCATLGTVGSGFTKLISTLVMLPIKVLSRLVDIVNKLPKPPPGVF